MKKEKYLIDTDILIDYLRGNPEAKKFLKKIILNDICCISTITIAELFSGVRDGVERTILSNFIGEFESASINSLHAENGGIFRREYGKSHNVGLADALIAAVAEDLGCILVTLNKKHYPMIKNILVPYAKG